MHYRILPDQMRRLVGQLASEPEIGDTMIVPRVSFVFTDAGWVAAEDAGGEVMASVRTVPLGSHHRQGSSCPECGNDAALRTIKMMEKAVATCFNCGHKWEPEVER